jgi:hypothetical protein
VGAEINGVLVTLNFFIMSALDDVDHQRAIVTRYFDDSARLQSFEYYWQEQREKILRLPEWPRLQGWNERLSQLWTHQDPLFEAILLFESLLIPPLDKCLSRSTRDFARRVVGRPEVEAVKMKRLFPKI